MKGVVDLGIGEPQFPTPAFIRNAAKRAIDSGKTKYTTNVGTAELRSEIARKLHRDNQVDIDPQKEVIVTAGATQAIFVVMNCLLNPGEEVLLPTPLFSAYKWAAVLAGGVPVEVPTIEDEGFALDFSALAASCSKRSKVLVLNSPCNPTGSVFNRREMEKACSFAEEHKLILISDEIYEKFLYDGARHFSPASLREFADRIVTINGFSKTYGMTGWRLGYAAANKDIINAMTRYNMYNAVCATSFVQAAGAEALRGSLSFFAPLLKEYERKRNLFCDMFREIGWNFQVPRGAFYIFPKLPEGSGDSLSFSKNLLREDKVATVPGSSFGASGEGHLRISYALNEREISKATRLFKKYAAT